MEHTGTIAFWGWGLGTRLNALLREMAGTEPQQIPADQPAVFTQAAAPPAYSSLPADQQKQQPPTAQQQQVPVQQLQQGAPFQAWPQGQVYQQGSVQYIAVSAIIMK